MNKTVLVLNQNYEPLNICNVRRAIVLIIGGKAEVLESHEAFIATAQDLFPYPSVIRLVCMIRAPRARVKLTRREVFLRDSYTCQYCGRRTNDLTLDHVIPRHRGGPHTWENLTSACRACNHRKGGKSLQEARMVLRQQPFEPSPGRYYAIERRIDRSISDGWFKFLPGIESSERFEQTVPLSAD